MIIWRNHFYLQEFCGGTYTVYNGSPIVGYYYSGVSLNGSNGNSMPLHLLRHEYAHSLYGGNNFHAGGGGSHENYFIPRSGGWSNLGSSGSSLMTWNGWDRQRLGWNAPGCSLIPSARNGNNTQFVNGYLDAADPNDAGIYYLRDFVTTGDAIKIRLPFIDPDNEYPEFVWIENHQGEQMNGSPFDRYQYQDNSCVEPLIPGLMMYLQIDKDIRTSGNNNIIWSGYAEYIRPLTADGYWDRDFETNIVQNDCVNTGFYHAFTKTLPNPLTGGCDQEHYEVDFGVPLHQLRYNDEQVQFIEKINGQYFNKLFQFGHTRHVFTLEGNHKVAISTNPSSASMMSLVGKDFPDYTKKNLLKIYLNGLSIEMLEQNSSGIKLNIRFDKVDVENDVRWCADTIILSPVTTQSGYSLNLKTGKTILLDQSLTATRMRDPVMFQGKEIFNSPTIFKCRANSWFNMEPNSTLIIDNSSKLLLLSGSRMDVGSGATVLIKRGGSLELQPNSTLNLLPGCSIIFEDGCDILCSAGSNFNIGNDVYFHAISGSCSINVNGNLQIGSGVDFIAEPNADIYFIINNTTLITSITNATFQRGILQSNQNSLTLNNCNFNVSGGVSFSLGNLTARGCHFDGATLHASNASIGSRQVTIDDHCTFINSTGYGVYILNYPNFSLRNNTFTSNSTGIGLFQSGLGRTHILVNNSISSNGTGILVYNSTATITSNSFINNGNKINNNYVGLQSYDHSLVSITGYSSATLWNETQQINNNTSYEVYATQGSFPCPFNFNAIIDDDNGGNPNDPLIYSTTTLIEFLDVRSNYWGINFNATQDLYPAPKYLWDPVWSLNGIGGGSSALALYESAEQSIENEAYADAKSDLKELVSNYPETMYAQSALKTLYPLEELTGNNYSSLQEYYRTNTAILGDSSLVKLANFLANFCDIKLENWPTAIAWFEDVIQQPETFEDSIFAIIDLGYTYWLMENSGLKSSYTGAMPQYKFGSQKDYEENRDYLLSLLPGDGLSEAMKQSLSALKTGELLQNIPNPFKGTTQIWFKLNEESNVSVTIYDYTGKAVSVINPGSLKSGNHSVEFNSANLPSGIYFYTLEVNGIKTDTKKMTLIR
jgi:hypothetical protein